MYPNKIVQEMRSTAESKLFSVGLWRSWHKSSLWAESTIHTYSRITKYLLWITKWNCPKTHGWPWFKSSPIGSACKKCHWVNGTLAGASCEVECPSGAQCISESSLCDGWIDCKDGSDEDEDFCRGFLVHDFNKRRNDRPCRPRTTGGAVFGGRQNSTLATVDGQKIIGGI